MKVRVHFDDVDCFGMLYHPNYLKYFERARTELLREQGFQMGRLAEQGYLFVIRKATLDYLRVARIDDELVVVTQVLERKPASAVFSQQIYSTQDVKMNLPFCMAQIKVVCVNQALKVQALPPGFLEF